VHLVSGLETLDLCAGFPKPNVAENTMRALSPSGAASILLRIPPPVALWFRSVAVSSCSNTIAYTTPSGIMIHIGRSSPAGHERSVIISQQVTEISIQRHFELMHPHNLYSPPWL